MLGRLTGGIATSLLFSVFEAWMIKEHFTNGYSGAGIVHLRMCEGGATGDLLSSTFTKAYFFNSIVAITAGLVGGFAADNYGPVAPFDVSLAMLVCGTIAIFFLWTENYGDAETENSSVGLGSGIKAVFGDSKLLLCGLVQSFFEGSMYTFVFMWTPALEEQAGLEQMPSIPHGMIFAIFMVSCMIGSMLVKEFDNRKITSSVYMPYTLAVASISILPAMFNQGFWPQLVGFSAFELCVGIYFPTWGNLRGSIVPENLRATVMNLYRVPLNLIVVLVLLNIGAMSTGAVFALCFVFLMLAAVSMHMLVPHLPKPSLMESNKEEVPASQDEEDPKPLLEQVLVETGLMEDKDVEV